VTEPKTVLLVEDHASTRALYGRVLRAAHYNVLLAGTFHDGMTSCAEHPVDLLITDIRLPDGDGVELARHFAREYPSKKILVITGSRPNDECAADLHASRQCHFLYKPIDLAVLQETLSIIL
jgi:DNA-binding NtrC family response regulator